MAVIVRGGGGPRVVVVDRRRTAATVSGSQAAVKVPSQTPVPVPVVDATKILEVAAPGPQGQRGPAGSALFDRIASTTLSGHRVVRSTGANTCGYASAADPSHADDVLGLTTGAAMAQQVVTLVEGSAFTEPSWAWTPQEPVYLGLDGLLTQTPLTAEEGAAFVLPMGFAQSPTTLFIRVGTPIYF